MIETTMIVIIAALLAVSEALALIPAVRGNGVVQAIWHILRKLACTAKKEV